MSLQLLMEEDGKAKMAKTSPILVSIDADEAHRPRARRLTKAIKSDGHFLLGKVENLSHDIRFQWMGRTLNVELKDFSSDGQSDYVNSIINSEGRLYQQVLTAREIEDPFIIAVLGGDTEVASAIDPVCLLKRFCGAGGRRQDHRIYSDGGDLRVQLRGQQYPGMEDAGQSIRANAPEGQEDHAGRGFFRLSSPSRRRRAKVSGAVLAHWKWHGPGKVGGCLREVQSHTAAQIAGHLPLRLPGNRPQACVAHPEDVGAA